ncbi:MAG: hypothetical protein EBR79_01745 [Proteobacteria bacterium]|nr:hypothetical protein [Pseudomonadota bacterium]NBX86863.1 hypothetical protein [Pseudomonadota bacterium]
MLMAVVENPFAFLLLPLGLVAVWWYHEQFMPKDIIGVTILYLTLYAVVIGIVAFVRPYMPTENADGWFIFRVFLILVAEGTSAVLAYPWFLETNGQTTANIVTVAATILVTGYWIYLERMPEESERAGRWVGLPTMFILGIVIAIGLHILPALSTAGRQTAGVENVRTGTSLVENALERAEQAQAGLASAKNLADSAATTLVRVINEEERVPVDTPLDQLTAAGQRATGTLSRQIRAAQNNVLNASQVLKTQSEQAQVLITPLRDRFKAVVGTLNTIRFDDKSVNPDNLLNELISIQAGANQLVTQAANTAKGLQGVFTNMAEPMEAELNKPNNSQGRIGIIRGHVVNIGNAEKSIQPVLTQIASLLPVTTRPSSRNVIDVVLDFRNPAQALGMMNEVVRYSFFPLFPAMLFLFTMALRKTNAVPRWFGVVMLVVLVGTLLYILSPLLVQLDWSRITKPFWPTTT